jgi:LuxR family maltose regulon positive regulatory protein
LAQARSTDPAGAVHLDQAIKLLAELRQELEHSGRLGLWLEALLLQAETHQLKSETEQAAAVLWQALELAQPAGYVRLFLDEGEPILSLLRQMAAAGPAPASLEQLLAAFAAEKSILPPSSSRSVLPPLIEPLSERELEILQLIAAGLSNRQIADTLILTVGTVKWYLNNIYGKLGVASRTLAVATARTRHFID